MVWMGATIVKMTETISAAVTTEMMTVAITEMTTMKTAITTATMTTITTVSKRIFWHLGRTGQLVCALPRHTVW